MDFGFHGFGHMRREVLTHHDAEAFPQIFFSVFSDME